MKFIWRDKLTVIISEMSRAAALDCARDIDEIPITDTSDEITRAIEGHVMRYAPTTVIVDGQVYKSGPVKVEYAEGESLEFSLPLTGATLNALPRTLANTWIEAALEENMWVVDDLKNALSRVTEIAQESQPGSE